MSENNHGSQPLLDVAASVLAMAKACGATAADAVASRRTEFEVKVADGAIVTLTQATSKGLGLRVFVDGRMGFCSTSDFRKDSLQHAVSRAVAMGREAAQDEHNGLAVVEGGHQQAGKELDLYDPAVPALSTDTKIEWAHSLEAAARESHPAVTKFRDSGVSSGESQSVLATSTGATRAIRGTGISIWSNPIAEKDGELQTEVWWDSRTHLGDLESVESVGRKAGQRAARMLGAKPIKTQAIPVIFEPHLAAGLLGGILGALNGDMVYKRASFLADLLGQEIAAPRLTLIDDPLLPRRTGSAPFDGEGLATSKKTLIDGGKLTTFLYDSYTARKAKTEPTASARRSYASLPTAGCFNLYVAPGQDDPKEIVAGCDKAFVITRGLGRGVNTVSGEYSRGANGLWIEGGEIIHPVQEVTIAGDFLTMLKGIDRVGSDLQMRGSSGAPTLRIAEMTVSGS